MARQLKAVEKSAASRVKAAEKRLYKQAADVIKKAEGKVESLQGGGNKVLAKRSPGRPKKVTTTKTTKTKASVKKAPTKQVAAKRGAGRPKKSVVATKTAVKSPVKKPITAKKSTVKKSIAKKKPGGKKARG